MVWEFVIWLAAASVLQVLLQGAGGLSPLVSLLIAAPAAAVAVTLGLIAVNGLVFLRLTEALAQLGPSLPAGLKIATFDDYPWNHVLFGGVTTAAQDTLTIAERVVERLSERIDVVTTTVGEAAKLAPKRIEVPGHIEHRASTSR